MSGHRYFILLRGNFEVIVPQGWHDAVKFGVGSSKPNLTPISAQVWCEAEKGRKFYQIFTKFQNINTSDGAFLARFSQNFQGFWKAHVLTPQSY